MSSFEIYGNKCLITESTALPAVTISMIILGLESMEQNSDILSEPTIPSLLFEDKKSCNTEVVLLNTATLKPFELRLRAKFAPIVPSPTMPISEPKNKHQLHCNNIAI